MKYKNWLIIIIVLAVLVRLVLSPITYHSDIQPFDLAGYVLSRGNVLNYYDYLPNLPDNSKILQVYPRNLFNYPPAVYTFLGANSLVWTFPINTNFHEQFLFNVRESFSNPLIYLHLLLLKIPFAIFDFLTAFVLMRLFSSQKQKLLVLALWLFNPVNIYVTYMIGQFDIIPVFFTIFSLFLARNERPKNLYLAAISLGLGGAFKIYPLFLLIPLCTMTSSWWMRTKILFLGILPYVLIMLPFLPSVGFRQTALLAGQTLKSFYAQIPISGGESLILFLVATLFVYFIFLSQTLHFEDLWKRYFLVLLIFFIFTHFHPQYFLWITPFFIFDLIYNRFKNLIVILVILFSYIGMTFFFDLGLTVGLFAPLNPSLYNLPTLTIILNYPLDVNFIRSLLQSVFAAGCFYYLYCYFPKTNLRLGEDK